MVKNGTKEGIQAIARANNFNINAPACKLNHRQNHTIAYVSHAYHMKSFSMDDLFSLEIMGGITNGLHQLGYEMLVVHVDPRDTGWAHRYLDSGRVEGFVLMTCSRQQWPIKTLVEEQAPFIIRGVPQPNLRYCSVTGDNYCAGKLANNLVQHIQTGVVTNVTVPVELVVRKSV